MSALPSAASSAFVGMGTGIGSAESVRVPAWVLAWFPVVVRALAPVLFPGRRAEQAPASPPAWGIRHRRRRLGLGSGVGFGSGFFGIVPSIVRGKGCGLITALVSMDAGPCGALATGVLASANELVPIGIADDPAVSSRHPAIAAISVFRCAC